MLVAQVSLGEESKVHRGAHMSLGEDFEVVPLNGRHD